MATSVRPDPFRSFNFKVEFDGLPVGSFSECSGLTAEGDSVDYREGTDMQLSVRKLIGMRKYTNIVLKRGYTVNGELWAWYKLIANGVAERRDGAIILQDEEHNEVMRWNVTKAWINKIEGPTFNATANEVAIESCELVHEGLELA